MTNASNCLLQHVCKARDNQTVCTRQCPHFIALHGHSGDGGRLAAANVPREYRFVTVSTSPVRADQPRVYRYVDAYVRSFRRAIENGERIRSLYLWSREPGTGKTTTACALINEWFIRYYVGVVARGERPEPIPAYFLDVNEFQIQHNLASKLEDKNELNAVKETIKLAQIVPFLVMDDLGVREPTEAFRSYLHAIINHRVTNRLPTVFTSNIPLDELPEVFGERRLYDRIRDNCVEIEFEGESKRGIRYE